MPDMPVSISDVYFPRISSILTERMGQNSQNLMHMKETYLTFVHIKLFLISMPNHETYPVNIAAFQRHIMIGSHFDLWVTLKYGQKASARPVSKNYFQGSH